MAFGFFERSRCKGAPVTLYRFQYGVENTHIYTMTDADESVSYGGNEYQPVPIQKSKTSSNGTLDNSTLEITTTRDNPVALLFRAYPPSYPITLTVFSGHHGDPDSEFIAEWTGLVLGCSLEEEQAVLNAEPFSVQRKRTTLRTHYQYGCPHVLYQKGPGLCNADKDRATFESLVLAVDGAVVTFPVNWRDENRIPWFNNGLIEWTRPDGQKEARTILRIDDNRKLLLSGLPIGLSPGDTVSVSYGCPHNMDGCATIHDNILNYGGCPNIPSVNPLGTNNIFY